MSHKFFLSLLHTFLLEVTNPKEKKKVFTSWLKSSSTDISPDDWDPLLLPWSFLYHSVRAEWTFPVTNNVLFLWCSEMSCPQLASAMTSRVEVPDKCRKLPEWTPGWAPAGEPGFSHGPCDNSTPPHTGHLTSGEWEEAVWDCVWPLLSSVQFSCSVMSDSRPHGLQHARPPCPSPTPGVYSNSCPLSQWCHPAISSSVIPFSFCLQSFPASGSFQTSQFFASGGQNTGVSASASVLPMNI